MRKYMVGFLSMLLLCSAAIGQSLEGYGFIAPGQIREGPVGMTAVHFGGGGRYITSSGLGFGAELGIAGATQAFAQSDFGLLSANGYYQFNTSSEKAKPFVTGGYSRSFGHDLNMNWGNFGGGLTYWVTERIGLLAEYRHHISRVSKDPGRSDLFQAWGVRMGFAFK